MRRVALLVVVLLLPWAAPSAGATLPTFTPLLDREGWIFGAPLEAPNGTVLVPALDRTTSTSGVLRIAPDLSTSFEATTLRPLGFDAAGRALVQDPLAPTEGEYLVGADGARLPVFHLAGVIGFGADGSLLLTRSCVPTPGASRTPCILHVHPDHSFEGVAAKQLVAYALAPDGSLFGKAASGSSLVRLDPATGATTGTWDLGFGFGAYPAAGGADGSLYLDAFANVTRFDPATGVAAPVASFPDASTSDARHLGFIGSRLWLTYSANGHGRVAYLDMPDAGFGGFHPVFEPTPVPNLAVTTLRVDPVGPTVGGHALTQRLTVEVTNLGAAAAHAWIAQVDWHGFQDTLRGGRAWLHVGDGLEPGATATFTADVDATTFVGTQTVSAYLNGDDVSAPPQWDVEPTYADNHAQLSFDEWVPTAPFS